MRLVDCIARLNSKQEDQTAWIERTCVASSEPALVSLSGESSQGSISANTQSSLKKWTWGDIRERTASVAIHLLDLGVRPQDRICNLGRNSLEWAILDLACSAINAIHVPIDARLGHASCQACIDRVEPKLLFVDEKSNLTAYSCQQVLALQSLNTISKGVSLDQCCVPYHEEDVANILFTSGTTSAHKGVMLSHRNLVSNAMAKLDAMPQVADDHRLNFLPFSHAYARTCELSTWLLSQSSMEVVHGIDSVLAHANTAHPTLINGVPLFFERLHSLWEDPSNGCDHSDSARSLGNILGPKIRRLASGGAPIRNVLRARFADAGLPVFQGYGLTETSPVVCSNRSSNSIGTNQWSSEILTEVGPVVQGVQIKIDADTKLWVKGNGVMKGYWNDPSETQRRIVDGWLDTGDLAEYVPSEDETESASIRILGRADDTIVLSTGYKIFPLAIEQLLRSQAWVSECMIVGHDRPYSILLLKPNVDKLLVATKERLESMLLDWLPSILKSYPSYAIPKAVLVCQEYWTPQSGLTNFKGGLRRKKIEAFYSTAIDQKYQESKSIS